MTHAHVLRNAAGLLLGGLMLAQCDRAPEAVPARPAAETPAPAPATPDPVIGRADLIAAAATAASRYAAGQAGTGDDAGLVGRRFAIRLPFGCFGADPSVAPDGDTAGGDGLARWRWGEDRRSLTLSLEAGDWTDSALVAGAGGQNRWEAVEGVWIPRTWLASEDCPAPRLDPLQAGGAAASPQTLGLAAVHGAEDSRLGRRDGRAYTHVVRAQGDAPLVPHPRGYRLVLEGRFVAFPDGRAVNCRAATPDQRPVCVAAAEIERVAFEDADRAPLAEWRR